MIGKDKYNLLFDSFKRRVIYRLYPMKLLIQIQIYKSISTSHSTCIENHPTHKSQLSGGCGCRQHDFTLHVLLHCFKIVLEQVCISVIMRAKVHLQVCKQAFSMKALNNVLLLPLPKTRIMHNFHCRCCSGNFAGLTAGFEKITCFGINPISADS